MLDVDSDPAVELTSDLLASTAPAAALMAVWSRRLASPREFWVKRLLNLMTLLIELKVATLMGIGCWVIKKVIPSEQGGVVREPV